MVVGSTEEDWITKTYDLSEYAGETVKIAIRYISQAVVGNGQTNAFMLMVDDFYVGQPDYYAEMVARAKARRAPVMSPANPNERFEIYKNGEKVGETEDYYYVLENLPAGNYTLGVKALYREAESNTTETQLAISDGDYVKATFRISTNNNALPGRDDHRLDCGGNRRGLQRDGDRRGNYCAFASERRIRDRRCCRQL